MKTAILLVAVQLVLLGKFIGANQSPEFTSTAILLTVSLIGLFAEASE